jgi:glyoxylase-like metal-dependent hydrolase (beta-lactamase superfamily II)
MFQEAKLRPKELLPGLFALRIKFVNVFWIVDGDSVTLIDTGLPGNDGTILDAISTCGRKPDDVRAILVTHCHYDHSGSLAALKNRTGATTYMHPLDAELVRQGRTMRPVVPAPSPFSGLIYHLVVKNFPLDRYPIDPVSVDRDLVDGQELPIADGIRAIHIPGHCAGQLAFLWNRHGGVLFAADAAVHGSDLKLARVYEDLAVGVRSLAKISALTFDNACFSHGRPILGGASEKFRAKWPAEETPTADRVSVRSGR